jgi:hypothetical protein
VRLGAAIRKAETTGIAWSVDEAKPNSKHQGRLQNHILFCHKDDYRDAEAIGHRT